MKGPEKGSSSRTVPSFMRSTAQSKGKENSVKYEYQDIKSSGAALAVLALMKMKGAGAAEMRKMREQALMHLREQLGNSKSLFGLKREELALLTKEDLAKMTLEQIATLSSDLVGHLTTEQISGLTIEQLSLFTPEQLASLTAEQVSSFSQDQLARYNSMMVSQLDGAQRAALLGASPSMQRLLDEAGAGAATDGRLASGAGGAEAEGAAEGAGSRGASGAGGATVSGSWDLASPSKGKGRRELWIMTKDQLDQIRGNGEEAFMGAFNVRIVDPNDPTSTAAVLGDESLSPGSRAAAAASAAEGGFGSEGGHAAAAARSGSLASSSLSAASKGSSSRSQAPGQAGREAHVGPSGGKQTSPKLSPTSGSGGSGGQVWPAAAKGSDAGGAGPGVYASQQRRTAGIGGPGDDEGLLSGPSARRPNETLAQWKARMTAALRRRRVQKESENGARDPNQQPWDGDEIEEDLGYGSDAEPSSAALPSSGSFIARQPRGSGGAPQAPLPPGLPSFAQFQGIGIPEEIVILIVPGPARVPPRAKSAARDPLTQEGLSGGASGAPSDILSEAASSRQGEVAWGRSHVMEMSRRTSLASDGGIEEENMGREEGAGPGGGGILWPGQIPAAARPVRLSARSHPEKERETELDVIEEHIISTWDSEETWRAVRELKLRESQKRSEASAGSLQPSIHTSLAPSSDVGAVSYSVSHTVTEGAESIQEDIPEEP